VVVRLSGDLCEVAFPSGRVLVDQDELEPLPTDPAGVLAVGELGRGLPYALRLQALYLQHAYRYDPLSGLSNARIEPTLHQVYIAHLLTQKLQPRMILADEVGLGKTIEAGLVIKELRARGLIERVLIVVPASLQLQWQQELRSKFNEEFEIIDGAAVKFLGKDGTNPWTKRPNVICSIQFARNAARAERIIEADWDLVVFDEAHQVRRRLEGKKVTTTQAYRLADELKELVNGLLLLTATPMQLHPIELYSLIELVEPGLYPTFERYDERRKELPVLNDLMKALKGWAALAPEDRAAVMSRHGALLAELAAGDGDLGPLLDDPDEKERLMDGLVHKHPLAGVLVRNRKAEIGGFTRREAQRALVELSDVERQLYWDVTDYIRYVYNQALKQKNRIVGFVMVTYQKMLTSSSYAIRQSLKRRSEKLKAELRALEEARKQRVSANRLDELADAEEISAALIETEAVIVDEEALRWEIDVLDGLVERLGKVRDAKAAELLKLLRPIFKERPDEKILIFTQFIETQEFLAGVLEQQGYSVATFNGQMRLEEKEEAVARFRRNAQILISTEAGGEGRNFQFCHVMVNYDLPWNPMKVEQRIGRLDRIGQKKPVFIYNLACADTIEERVLQVLEDRIGLFVESVGSLDPILGEVEKDIEELVMEQLERFDEAFEEYEQRLEQRVLEAKERERVLADFVLDRASLRRDVANDLLERAPLARHTDLRAFVGEALEYYGGHLSEDEGNDVISLSPRLSTRLRTRASVVQGVFDWRRALEREELDFFAFGHELIDRLVQLPIDIEPATTGARRLPDLPAGTWLEMFYEFNAKGVRSSGEIRRHVVGPDLEVRSTRLETMPALGDPLDDVPVPGWVPGAIEASRAVFEQEYGLERARVQAEDEEVKVEELRRAERIFEYRRVRFQKLIEDQEAWIREKEATGSERDHRILPARRGKLAKDRERLERLRFEYEQQVEEIRSRVVGVDAKVLAAGLVVGG